MSMTPRDKSSIKMGYSGNELLKGFNKDPDKDVKPTIHQ